MVTSESTRPKSKHRVAFCCHGTGPLLSEVTLTEISTRDNDLFNEVSTLYNLSIRPQGERLQFQENNLKACKPNSNVGRTFSS